jgi:ribose transport system ATP-binding protein
MQTPILEMQGISKRFPGVKALDGVDLQVYGSEIVALIGENGAGKSTLMKILGGVHQPDTGSIHIEGKPVTIRSVADAFDLKIGFIHQELNTLDNLDVAANVFLGREPLKAGPLKLVDNEKMHTQTAVYLKRLGLNISSRTLVGNLSIAQKQLVEIAKALSQNARILIMDEPTSSLTLSETERLLQVVAELRAEGVSVIYISHRLSEIESFADRVVALRDGANAGTLGREEITRDKMIKLMIGRDLKDFYVKRDTKKVENFFQVQNLRTRKYANHPVSFDVYKGEILGMAGLVGAGRSEVAQAIFGVDVALGGNIFIGGKKVHIHSSKDAIANGIYLVPEDRRNTGLIVDMVIRENITMPALPDYAWKGLIKRDMEKDVSTRMCKSLNIKTPSIETTVANLSGGNQQKVVLAKWLSLNPKVLIFDEPTRGIDIKAKSEIYELMRGLADQGVAVIMISSDMEEVLGISDRVAVMQEGIVAGILNREDCSEEAIMRLAVSNG